MMPGETQEEQWSSIHHGLSRVTISPGKVGIGTYAPPLDAAGNSVRAHIATAYLSRALGLNIFASRPRVSSSALLPDGGHCVAQGLNGRRGNVCQSFFSSCASMTRIPLGPRRYVSLYTSP